MNKFYQVYRNGEKPTTIKLDLYLGDEFIPTEVGCFEVFFLIDADDQIKKMECNFYLGYLNKLNNLVSSMPLLHDAEWYYINSPKDLLVHHDGFVNRMAITESGCLDDVSRFTEYYAPYRATASEQKHKKIIEAPDGIYETIGLPDILKWQCKKSAYFPNGELFGASGCLFQFSTSVPKILGQINYNTLNQCTVEQFHGGVGNNDKK